MGRQSKRAAKQPPTPEPTDSDDACSVESDASMDPLDLADPIGAFAVAEPAMRPRIYAMRSHALAIDRLTAPACAGGEAGGAGDELAALLVDELAALTKTVIDPRGAAVAAAGAEPVVHGAGEGDLELSFWAAALNSLCAVGFGELSSRDGDIFAALKNVGMAWAGPADSPLAAAKFTFEFLPAARKFFADESLSLTLHFAAKAPVFDLSGAASFAHVVRAEADEVHWAGDLAFEKPTPAPELAAGGEGSDEEAADVEEDEEEDEAAGLLGDAFDLPIFSLLFDPEQRRFFVAPDEPLPVRPVTAEGAFDHTVEDLPETPAHDHRQRRAAALGPAAAAGRSLFALLQDVALRPATMVRVLQEEMRMMEMAGDEEGDEEEDDFEEADDSDASAGEAPPRKAARKERRGGEPAAPAPPPKECQQQ